MDNCARLAAKVQRDLPADFGGATDRSMLRPTNEKTRKRRAHDRRSQSAIGPDRRLSTPSELRPFKHNARTHPRRQIDQIAASIEAFGSVNPILIDPDGEIIAGHGRLLAAKQIDLGRVPTITLAGMSDRQKRALRLADNKIGLNASWDTEMLRIELGELSALDSEIGVDLTGFSPGEIDVALTMAVDPDDEAIPPVPADPVTQPGDIWQLGEHRLGCGDGGDRAFLRAVIGSDQPIDASIRALPIRWASMSIRPATSTSPSRAWSPVSAGHGSRLARSDGFTRT
ncbi:ParB/Srx family N-terminal domain-containing protein [Roseitalea porphyridii]|uniref:ParB/Srx family N-terminal domain-containing protein n=1 Tax=Roseitalea porphyridii TaxID=1852022 RepID=UPI001FCE67B4|nr:ParB/Srx family N-terminal domain-containing protein [Roseitalea porphyridii]